MENKITKRDAAEAFEFAYNAFMDEDVLFETADRVSVRDDDGCALPRSRDAMHLVREYFQK